MFSALASRDNYLWNNKQTNKQTNQIRSGPHLDLLNQTLWGWGPSMSMCETSYATVIHSLAWVSRVDILELSDLIHCRGSNFISMLMTPKLTSQGLTFLPSPRCIFPTAFRYLLVVVLETCQAQWVFPLPSRATLLCPQSQSMPGLVTYLISQVRHWGHLHFLLSTHPAHPTGHQDLSNFSQVRPLCLFLAPEHRFSILCLIFCSGFLTRIMASPMPPVALECFPNDH